MKRRMTRVLGAIIVTLPLAAQAQTQSQPPAGDAGNSAELVGVLRSFLESENYRKSVTDLIRSTEATLPLPACDKLEPNFDPTQHRLTLLGPLSLDKDRGMPARGLWSSSVPVDRCGTTVRRSVLVQAAGDGQFRFAAMFPGDTLTNARIQADITKAALAGVGAQFGCAEQVKVIDTTIAEKPASGAWTEIWTFAGCGSSQPRAVRFTPSAGGQGIDFAIADTPPAVKP